MAFTVGYTGDSYQVSGALGASGKNSFFIYECVPYQVGYNSNGDLGVLVTDDDGATWQELDAANSPNTPANAYEVQAIRWSNLLYVVYEYINTSGGIRTSEIRAKAFNLDTRTWTGSILTSGYTSMGAVGSVGSTELLGVCPLANTGDFAVLFTGDMASTNNKAAYIGAYVSGSWLSVTQIDTDEPVIFNPPGMYGSYGEIIYDSASGLIRAFWSRRTGTNTSDLKQRTCNTSLSLNSTQVIASLFFYIFANSVWIGNAVIKDSIVYLAFNYRYDPVAALPNANRGQPAIYYGTAGDQSPSWTLQIIDNETEFYVRSPYIFVGNDSKLAAIYSWIYWLSSATHYTTNLSTIFYKKRTGTIWDTTATILMEFEDPPLIITPPYLTTPADWYISDIYQVSAAAADNSVGFSASAQFDFTQDVSPFGFASVGYSLVDPDTSCFCCDCSIAF